MAQIGTVQANNKLPVAVRRLVDENKQRRAGDKMGGDFRGRLNKTVAYLRWKAACNTLSGAVGYIRSELERERLYGLYRQIFPKQWKASRASFKRTGDKARSSGSGDAEFGNSTGSFAGKGR